jgi:hypothetical protein
MKSTRTKKMKLVKKLSKNASKKGSKKATRKFKGGAKRKFREIDTDLHRTFQPLIDAIGTPNILDSLASLLGREGLQSETERKSGKSEGIASRIRRSTNSIPDDFSGIIHDGVHWKGYEATEQDGTRVVYDSYVYDLQMSGTNNFCQSYAVFLWATKGEVSAKIGDGIEVIEINLIPGHYRHNVKQMATLWLAWLETMLEVDNSGSREWVQEAIPAPFNIDMIRDTMTKLSEDDEEATAFSTSS